MSNLRSVCLLLAVCAIWVNGHSYFSSITIDGVARAEDECMRPHPGSQYDYPISQKGRPNGLQTDDMICGWLPSASRPANKKCPVNPGSKVVIQWHYERGMGNSDTFIIDPSHKGPCIVYMAKSETGTGPVWFKIFEDGYDQSTKKWCVDKLRANKGKLEVTIPTDIAPGNYLFRSELIALHEGHELYGAQPYVGCAELTVGGSGTVDPPNKVAFPGAYTARDAGIFFNIYTSKNPPYPIPGPPVYRSGSTPSTPSTPSTTAAPSNPPSTPRTTAAPPRSTTGRSSNSGSGSSTTGRVPSNPPSTPQTTGANVPSNPPSPPSGNAPCTLGHQKCASDNTYQTCGWASQTITGWASPQNCPTGLRCRPHPDQANYIWCY